MGKNLFGVFALSALGLSAWGCAGRGSDEALQGVVEHDEVTYGFEVGGRLRSVEVLRGARVEVSATLATLDDTLVRLSRDARLAETRSLRAQLGLTRAGARKEDRRAALAQLDAARESEQTIARALERRKTLVAGGAAAPATLDDLEAQLARAHGERRAAEERVAALESGSRSEELRFAEARLSAAEAAVASEEARLERHTLTATRGGIVVAVPVDAGEVVGAGMPVVTVADVAHPFVDVFVPQARLHAVKVGRSVEVRVDAEAAPLKGVIEDVGRRTEFTPRYLFSERERPNLVVRTRVRVADPETKLPAGVPAFVTLAGAP